jgi:hypothetical protein
LQPVQIARVALAASLNTLLVDALQHLFRGDNCENQIDGFASGVVPFRCAGVRSVVVSNRRGGYDCEHEQLAHE